MTLYYVGVGVDDWWSSTALGTNNYTTTRLNAGWNNVIVGGDIRNAYADVDTSSIGTDVISSATLYLNEYDYSVVGRGVAKTYRVRIWTGSNFVTLTNGSLTFTTATTRSIVLTSTEIGYINKTGKTSFSIQVDDPGAGCSRIFRCNAYETSQATALRLNVDHAPAGAAYYNVSICTS